MRLKYLLVFAFAFPFPFRVLVAITHYYFILFFALCQYRKHKKPRGSAGVCVGCLFAFFIGGSMIKTVI